MKAGNWMRRCVAVLVAAVSVGCATIEEEAADDRLVGTRWEARDLPYEEQQGGASAYNIYEFICPRLVEQYVMQDGHVVGPSAHSPMSWSIRC